RVRCASRSTGRSSRSEPVTRRSRVRSSRSSRSWAFPRGARRRARSPSNRGCAVPDPVPGAEAAAPVPEYVAGHLEETLLLDGRVGEEGPHVELHGTRLVITGRVGTERRRANVDVVAAETAPAGFEIVNHTEVTLPGADAHDEEFR